MIQPVVLCGGSGTRLWPLSRKAFPKQFIELFAGKSLLALTLERVAPLLDADGDIVCVGAEEHRFMLGDAVAGTGARATLVLEPCARNTAAAMLLAALQAPDPDRLQLFCPSDQHIPDAAAFAAMVRSGVAAAQQGAIVVFGVVPTHPSTAYGYIERAGPHAHGGHRVARFVEKPDAQRAQELMGNADVLWNAGIFLCKPGVLLQGMERHAPDILASCRQAMAGADRRGGLVRPDAAALRDCRAESIDVALMERHGGLVVWPFQGAWSDVGSWNAVADLRAPDEHGNRIEGQGVLAGAVNRNYIHAPYRRVVALGTNNLIIIDTPDALLVADRSAAEQVKGVVDQLERGGSPEATSHRKVVRPWGYYDSVERGERFQVKRLFVNPLGALSLQMHRHRSEHWTVVRGTAEVTLGTRTFLLAENQSVDIPAGTLHRLCNPGMTPIELIEVQSGDYLGEDDIVRFEDAYGRSVAALAPVSEPDGTFHAPVPNGHAKDLGAGRPRPE
ncbi:mannose-1-phosphate guanylyltransferase/mannose-6-phosphate isomerase [Ramlibacter tataouinensis]|uniref:mannose-1-phosphate guanylyltransferase/mannose-6-phosphate isomerase n=1 Tax=Ramlibacter tataouinensis TaxID=94132 RepID=UPI0022F3A505|nr:mannose-1-phosphate guanylyltransferase/mannose-6-phosphate isomerase [Ramlibacter tataouinensis]WBY00801.1 mannose-1-phosphate guanylyltransferase/mannose-6-phosphate isomerase [Ramlibacter tataouinensis]